MNQDISVAGIGGPQESMTNWIGILRSLFLVALAIYTGGLRVYGAVVIRVLHQRLAALFRLD